MKIKKFNEEHLHNTEDDIEFLNEWGDSLLAKYFDENDISHSELMKRSSNNNFLKKDIILVVEFNVEDLKPKVFSDISKYMEYMEKLGMCSAYAGNNKEGTEWIGIQSVIFEDKFPEDLKMLINTKKYNL